MSVYQVLSDKHCERSGVSVEIGQRKSRSFPFLVVVIDADLRETRRECRTLAEAEAWQSLYLEAGRFDDGTVAREVGLWSVSYKELGSRVAVSYCRDARGCEQLCANGMGRTGKAFRVSCPAVAILDFESFVMAALIGQRGVTGVPAFACAA